jgi:hypothetical protein
VVAWPSTVVTIVVIFSVAVGVTEGLKEEVGKVIVSEMGGGIVEELEG